MGCVKGIDFKNFPKQGKYLHKRVKVCFNYSSPDIGGRCVRNDMEEPYVTIFCLDDGRFVLSVECQYSEE